MIKKNFSFFIINRSNGKIRYNRIRHPRNHSPMVREKVLIPCMLTQESIPRKVKTILHAGIPSGKILWTEWLWKGETGNKQCKVYKRESGCAEIFSYNILRG